MDTKLLRHIADSLVSDIKHLRLDGPEPDSASQAEITRLQSAKLMREAATEIETLERRIRMLKQDAREDARSSSTEATWRERQGEDYGTY